MNTCMDLGIGFSLFLILKTIVYYLEKDTVSSFKQNILKHTHYEHLEKQEASQNPIHPTRLIILDRRNGTNNDFVIKADLTSLSSAAKVSGKCINLVEKKLSSAVFRV